MRFHLGDHSGLRLYKKEEPGLKRWKKLMATCRTFIGQSTQSNPTNFVGLLCLIIKVGAFFYNTEIEYASYEMYRVNAASF